jgi:hypothetical protein
VSPSPSVPPGQDACLWGSWRVTSGQQYSKINSAQVQYTGGRGAVLYILHNGILRWDFNASEPLVAIFGGARWEQVDRGTASANYHVQDGEIRISGQQATGTSTLNRNGKYNNSQALNLTLAADKFVCDDASLRTYSSDGQSSYEFERIGPPPER